MFIQRRSTVMVKTLALVACAGALPFAGCGVKGTEFRSATAAPLQSGLIEITNGLLDGLFAVYAPDDDNSDGSSGDNTGTSQ